MKRQLVVMSIAILMLSGCAASSAPSPVAAPTQAPAPAPTPMSISEAGDLYLATVCPGNLAFVKLNDALKAGDLPTINTEAATTRDLYESSAKVFGDTTIVWPAEVSSADLKLAGDRNAEFATLFDDVSMAQDLDTAYGTVGEWENAPDKTVRDDGLAAAKRLRAALGLPDDTSAGC